MFYARWTRKGVPAETSFVDRLQPYVVEWVSAVLEQNVVSEHRLHATTAAWVVYLQWYLPRTRTRVTYMPATSPPPPVPDHDRVLPDATYTMHRDQTADTAVSYDTANILHSYDFSLKHVSNFVRSTMRWLRSCGSHRARSGSASPGGLRSTGARTRGSSLRP
jgi:hypothetical protein